MAAYYNEFDPKAAAWLRELIKQGHIADGEVDERRIEDVTPTELAGFTQCHFFAGFGVSTTFSTTAPSISASIASVSVTLPCVARGLTTSIYPRPGRSA
jgi:hypothetical protein